MSRMTLMAASLLISTTLVYACTAAKGPTANGPATNPLTASLSGRDINAKLFARANKATAPGANVHVASLLKDDDLGLVVGKFVMRVEPAKTLSTKSEDGDASADTGPTSTPASDDETHAVTPSAVPSADEAQASAEDWAHDSDPEDDEWIAHEAKDDPEDADAYGETDAGVGGGPNHHLVFHESDYPVMDDQDDTLVVEDQSAGKKQVTFSADQDYLHFSATGASGAKLSVTINPDGTYTVNGKTVATAKEAAQLIQASPVSGEITSETLAFLYASLKQRDTVASTLTVKCVNMLGGAAPSPTDLVHEILALRLKK